jgi:hypothetical protein
MKVLIVLAMNSEKNLIPEFSLLPKTSTLKGLEKFLQINNVEFYGFACDKNENTKAVRLCGEHKIKGKNWEKSDVAELFNALMNQPLKEVKKWITAEDIARANKKLDDMGIY